jgi:hypothetical protein
LWGALLLAGAAWSSHLLISHFLVEASCGPGATGGGVDVILLVVTVVTASLALVAALFAAARRRVLEHRGPGLERAAGLATVISALAGYFVLVILLESLPLLVLRCGGP